MAGHSKWAGIKHKKAAQDAKKGKAFTKVANMISVAARNGSDPNTNPALALAIEKAKSVNMPKANIERAIKKGAGELGGETVEETIYEGYGPEGVALIIEVATDNRNRAISEIRAVLSKNNGSLASNGAVMYNFERRGQIIINNKAQNLTLEELEEAIIESGALDLEIDDDYSIVHTAPKDLMAVKKSLEDSKVVVDSVEISYIPKNKVEIDDKEKAEKIINLLETLGDLDDVTAVHSNFEISDKVAKEMQ